MSSRTFLAFLRAALCFLLAGTFHLNAAKIVWVSFHPGDTTPNNAARTAGFLEAPDVEYTRLLQSAGHEVTRYTTTATPDVPFLNTFDLVIISRSVPSGNYQTPESTALWHSITKPMIIMGGYVLRSTRLGFTTGEVIPDTSGTIALQVNDPSHPIFTRVALNESGLMVNPYAHRMSFNGTLQRGISVNTDAPSGGTVLASVGTDTDAAFGGMIIGEYPAGTAMANASGDITAGKRLVLLSGSREVSGGVADAAGIFDLDLDGSRIFINAVNYMAGLPITEPPPRIVDLRPAIGAKLHLAAAGLSFRVVTRDLQGIPTQNISLELNGADVTSSLTIGGTAQERVVSFAGLQPNTQYTGVIKVRDAFNQETTLPIQFDTLLPQTLDPQFALPANSAVTSKPGLLARVAQAWDFSTLGSSAERAEQQLAGTLIDPATLEPYPNLATPSADNPDGAYNQDFINWSIEAGFALERGNFREPEYPDQRPPGTVHDFNFAAEIVTYLELAPGRYIMGVNSDDGFVLSSGVHVKDVLSQVLGRFDGGRAAADTIFQFEVTEAGIYPFRLLYYQGTAEGSLEWFSVDPLTDEKILINDRSNPKAIRGWREVNAAARPYVASVNPASGAMNVAVDTTISMEIQDTSVTVQQNTAELTLNGQPVVAQIAKANGKTTISYSPPQPLLGDTTYTVGISYTESSSAERTGSFQFTTKYVPAREAAPARIAFVSFHPGNDEPSGGAVGVGFEEAPDAEYVRLLEAAGHTVTRYPTTPTPDVEFLNSFDLIIVSRSVPSGHYQTPESTLAWHSITKPMMHLGGYALRGSRLGFFAADGIPDTAGTVRLRVNNPAHPIFAGVNLDTANLMTRPYAHRMTFNGTLQRGISVNNSAIAAGGTILAAIGTVGDAAFNGTVAAEFPAGTTMANTALDVTAGKRLVLLTGSREPDGGNSEGAGMYDLDSAGARIFINAVRYMANLTPPAELQLSVQRTPQGALRISWPEAGSQDHLIESTQSLLPAQWEPLAGTPGVENSERFVTVQPTGGPMFFRLRRP